MSFVVTSFLLGTSPRARTHYCGTPHWQHQSKASSFPGFGCRIIYLFFNYCRSHVLLLVQTFSILSELHGDKFPSLGFDCFNQLYGLLIFSSSKNSAWVKVLLNPCSSEENNGNNYRKQKNTGDENLLSQCDNWLFLDWGKEVAHLWLWYYWYQMSSGP